MDSALLAVLVEHHNNGDHAQNDWKPHVYNAAIKHVFEKCSMIITKDNIVSRCKTFDKHYEIISKILRVVLVGIGTIISCKLIVRRFGLNMLRLIRQQLVTRLRW